ncbi:hypothetical protein [Marinilactibacillus sp. Marseille-P9653]|uniref:hypothetical protein n=1 Tax=Marinilactibacillus sp. Marseille-P9653 TaxID=2866583 RepID=UPI001CE3E550|nr:hypothetical protein [Marinilactibacillus sp. Marseille-P9653]
MKNWTKIITLLTVGAALAACSNNNDEAVVAPETEQETTTEIDTESTETAETVDETDDKRSAYQAELDQAQAQYDNEQLDESAGTLSVLLKEDLTEYQAIKDEAEGLLEKVTLAQAEQARQVAGASSDKTEYQTERSSSVLAEKYLAETGQSIEAATDEELGSWLSAQDKKAEETSSSSETDSEETTETEAEPENKFATDEEAEDYAFDQLIGRLGLSNENYSYFVNKTDDQWVTIEARESMEQDGVEWSNMIGMYRYNLENDSIEKLNSVSGNYENVNKGI